MSREYFRCLLWLLFRRRPPFTILLYDAFPLVLQEYYFRVGRPSPPGHRFQAHPPPNPRTRSVPPTVKSLFHPFFLWAHPGSSLFGHIWLLFFYLFSVFILSVTLTSDLVPAVTPSWRSLFPLRRVPGLKDGCRPLSRSMLPR